MRNQGYLRPMPKTVSVIITVEGTKIAFIQSIGFFGKSITINKELYKEIGRTTGWTKNNG